jgi:hypothetical protein
MGFTSGEYGGKNMLLHPTDSLHSLVRLDL